MLSRQEPENSNQRSINRIRSINGLFSATSSGPSGSEASFPSERSGATRPFRKNLAFLGKAAKRSLVPILLLGGLSGKGQIAPCAPGFKGAFPGYENKDCSALQVANVLDHSLEGAPRTGGGRTIVPFSKEKDGQVERAVQDILHTSDLKQLQLLIKKREGRAFQKTLCEKQILLKTPPGACYGFPDLKDRADFHCLNLKIQNVNLPSLNKALKNDRLSGTCRKRLEFFKKILLYRQKDTLLSQP